MEDQGRASPASTIQGKRTQRTKQMIQQHSISRFDSAKSAETVRKIQKLLTDSQLGVSVGVKTWRWDQNTIELKLELGTISEDGVIFSREREDFRKYATQYDLKPEWLDRIITYRNQKYKIVGLSPGRSKFPVVVESNGKQSFFRAEALAAAMMNPDHPEKALRDKRLKEFRAFYLMRAHPGSELQEAWLDKSFSYGGRDIKISGLTTKGRGYKRKLVILCEDSRNHKLYNVPIEAVIKAMTPPTKKEIPAAA